MNNMTRIVVRRQGIILRLITYGQNCDAQGFLSLREDGGGLEQYTLREKGNKIK